MRVFYRRTPALALVVLALAAASGRGALAQGDIPPPNEPLAGRARALSAAEIRDLYAGSLRHFNRRLSQADARKIADSLLRHSREGGLDARLVVAVMAKDGLLARVRPGKRGPAINGRPAGDAVASVAADLSRRIRTAMPGKSPAQAIRQALTWRAAARLPKGPASVKRASAYAAAVEKLYAQISGMG